jgi:hypothetical protein
MGGHGALSLFLKNPGKYKSVSAFAPISNPLKAPWGEKAFKGYFGEKDWQSKGADHDATELIKKWKGGPLDILIDVVCLMISAIRSTNKLPGYGRQLLQAIAATTRKSGGSSEGGRPRKGRQRPIPARLRPQLLHYGVVCR